MHKLSILIIIVLFFGFMGNRAETKKIINNQESDCSWNGLSLYGKVKFVESFPDIKIQIVDAFPDIKVKYVESFPDDCGKWQMVESFPDFTVQLVESFPDIKVKIVDAFPGMD